MIQAKSSHIIVFLISFDQIRNATKLLIYLNLFIFSAFKRVSFHLPGTNIDLKCEVYRANEVNIMVFTSNDLQFSDGSLQFLTK